MSSSLKTSSEYLNFLKECLSLRLFFSKLHSMSSSYFDVRLSAPLRVKMCFPEEFSWRDERFNSVGNFSSSLKKLQQLCNLFYSSFKLLTTFRHLSFYDPPGDLTFCEEKNKMQLWCSSIISYQIVVTIDEIEID